MIKIDSKIPEGPVAEKWTNYKAHQKLVNPANKRRLDIIVVGTGLAGASAAASLGEMGFRVFNFWAKMQLPELMHNMGMHADTLTLAYAANGAYHIQQTFSCPVYVVLYLVWLFALWFHLTHGFWSSMQSLGWNNKVWIDRWKCISNIYSTIVVLGFALVVVVFFVKTLICGGAC